MKLSKVPKLSDINKTKKVHNWINNNYLITLTSAGLKSISETQMHRDLVDLGPFTHEGCLFIPFMGDDYWVINEQEIKKNLSNKKNYYTSHVSSFEEVLELLTKRDKFCQKKSMTHYDYLYLMGRLFGYPELNCKIFAKEVSSRDVSALRSDRLFVTSSIKGVPQQELSIVSYRKYEESLNLALKLIHTWDKHFLKNKK